jgi:hypothetical protein
VGRPARAHRAATLAAMLQKVKPYTK